MEIHGREVTRAIETQNEFEFREGLITEPAKSWLLPVGHDTWPGVIVDGHHYQAPDGPISLLGLDVTKRSMINVQVRKNVLKAETNLLSLHRFSSMKTKFKLHLVKALVLPHLYYPPVPLHLASRNQMRKLQVVQNKALRFAFNIKWYEFKTNKEIHKMKPIHMPVNQVLYWRAKKNWEAIDSGAAGDSQLLEDLFDLEVDFLHAYKRMKKFPSSYAATMRRPEPAPRYK